MKRFIDESSIVRKIWGTPDITLFIFAGASAEFALNKEVDWLYFTGKLPADPIGRLFSTVQYAHEIIFNNEAGSVASIDRINKIHQAVESSRHSKISEAGYKDVLFMLIHYSVASFELVERKLADNEKDEVVQTFQRIGERMHMHGLPGNYSAWLQVYEVHLQQNLENSAYTKDLFKQYRKHLGAFRYFVLIEIQKKLVPAQVSKLLRFGRPLVVSSLVPFYRVIRKLGLSELLIGAMIPQQFKSQYRNMLSASGRPQR